MTTFKFNALVSSGEPRASLVAAVGSALTNAFRRSGKGGFPYSTTLDGDDFRRAAKGYLNVREAVGDNIDIAMHCLAQFDPRSAIGLCKAIEPADPLWIEDPLPTAYSEAWLELKRSTRVPVLTGERLELVTGFKPFLDNQVVDVIHPDVAYAGGITACRDIAKYASLTRTPVGFHSGPCSLIQFYAADAPRLCHLEPVQSRERSGSVPREQGGYGPGCQTRPAEGQVSRPRRTWAGP